MLKFSFSCDILDVWFEWGVDIMKAPKMIIFDYGQTLADEAPFDGIAGTKALLSYAVQNKYDLTA